MNVRELFFKSEPKLEQNLPFPRCEHLSPAGRRCSQPICSTSATFCFLHKPKPEDLLIAELTAAAGSLSTPEEIHHFLTRVTLLRVQGRLTPKESCAYAYLCMVLQRGQHEIAWHQKLRDERDELEAEKARADKALFSSWDIPRPDRSSPDHPLASGTGNSTQTPATAEGEPMRTTPADLESIPQTPAVAVSTVSHPGQRPAPSAGCSGGTVASNATPATLDDTITPPPAKSPAKKSATESSSPNKSASESSPPSRPLPPGFYNHCYPIDLTLPPGSQDLSKNIPHPDAAECARRNARRGLDFSRHRKSASRFFHFWR